MGFDITYHLISREEMNRWYFDRLPEAAEGDFKGAGRIGREDGVAPDMQEHYENALKIGADDLEEEGTFERNHGYVMAVVQGFFQQYFYMRGSAFSFLIEENERFWQYVEPWETIIPPWISDPIAGGLESNYCGGVYIGIDGVRRLLADMETEPNIREQVSDFYGPNLPVFLHALEVAAQTGKGLLEASEVIETRPLAASFSGCYTDERHCAGEGLQIYRRIAEAQIDSLFSKETKSD